MDEGGSRRSNDRDDLRADHDARIPVRSSGSSKSGGSDPHRRPEQSRISSQLRLCWRDAEQAAARLTPAERETLRMLIRLPFADVTLLTHLDGLSGGAATYRRVSRLRSTGLVAALRPPIDVGHSPALLYLTDLGLAVIAVAERVAPDAIIRSFRLSRGDLQRRLRGLRQLCAVYAMLGAVARSDQGWPRLKVWEQPYRRNVHVPTTKSRIALEIPACALLGWDDRVCAYLLQPDLGTSDLRAFRPMLHRLHRVRGVMGGLPLLVIAAPRRRYDAWDDLVRDIASSRRDTPIAAWIARWESLDADLEGMTASGRSREIPPGFAVRSVSLEVLDPQSPDAPLPHPVGDPTAGSRRTCGTTARLAQFACQMSPSDSYFLHTVGRHPFLPLDGLATVLGWSRGRIRLRCKELVQRGLVRMLDQCESRHDMSDLPELTGDGLRLMASELGFPLHRAVLTEGLAGGGPDESIGRRRNLVRNLAHTLGADAVFVHLYGLARRRASTGADDRVVQWSGPAACAHGRVRPDGYGIYQHAGTVCHFFLEYDRGTSGVHGLLRKLHAYYDYLETGRFQRDFQRFPDILVVTTSNAAEARFARAARLASIGRLARLPLLLTTEWRNVDDPANRDGLLGAVWRGPDDSFDQRRRWL